MTGDGTFYHDLGPDHFHRTSPEAQARRLVGQIAKLGFVCTITEAQPEPVVSVLTVLLKPVQRYRVSHEQCECKLR
jgi:hypothetical protein